MTTIIENLRTRKLQLEQQLKQSTSAEDVSGSRGS
jgi:hypothetical protein